MAAQITYPKLAENNEPQWWQGGSYLTDIDAVGQAIRTRLLLFEAEWWSDRQDGTPWWQRILGVGGAGKNPQAVNLALTSRILGTPFVLSLQNVQSSYNPDTREFKFYAEAVTKFGVVPVKNVPTPPDQRLPT